MTSWLLIQGTSRAGFPVAHRGDGPAHEWAGFSFTRSWPLLLILAGLLSLAERGALAQANRDDYDPITGQPRPPDTTIYGGPGRSIVPAGAAAITPTTLPPGPESGARGGRNGSLASPIRPDSAIQDRGMARPIGVPRRTRIEASEITGRPSGATSAITGGRCTGRRLSARSSCSPVGVVALLITGGKLSAPEFCRTG